MLDNCPITRRTTLKGIGALSAWPLLDAASPVSAAGGDDFNEAFAADPVRKAVFKKVFATPLIDTHEHLLEESDRLAGVKHPRVRSDDWSILLSHYLDSDLLTAGMPPADHGRFFSPDVDPVEKWTLLAPWWPAVKHTGYGLAVRLAVRHLYGVDDLSKDTIAKVQSGYESTRRRGFYRAILTDAAGIESCQVNSLQSAFGRTEMRDLLMQDISIVGMFAGPHIDGYARPAGIEVKGLADWHRVIDWWFKTYSPVAVAVKSQNAYSRDIDYQDVPASDAEEVFASLRNGDPISGEHRRRLEDHLFWCAARKAAASGLPVKLHTGYYAGQNSMPLDRLIRNAGSACHLCRTAPDVPFVFMHICYPYYEEILSVAKQYANAHIDMCWSWIINPIATKDFLKKYLVTAPANKILTFGGDYIPVEPVLGHALIARRGIALALSELVEEGWLRLDDALTLTDPIMHGNARRIFKVEEKQKRFRDFEYPA